MKSTGKKSERLNQLELLLLSHPEGLRRAEIARRLGVHRATAGRYIDELSTHFPLWEQDFRVGIKFTKSSQLNHIGLLEGLSFYLGLRSFAENFPYRFPEGAAAIRKLSAFIKSFSPAMAKQLNTVSDYLDSSDKEENPDFWDQLERIGEAWLSSQPVNIVFQEGKERVSLFCRIRDIRMNEDDPGILVDLSPHDCRAALERTLDVSRILSVDCSMSEPANQLKIQK